MRYRYLIVVGVILAHTTSGIAQNQDSTKNHYHIFHPTPREKMREMETDRPDVTESAYTVDAGHFQYEIDLFKTSVNKNEGVKTIETVFNYGNFKIGVTNSTDLQLVIQSYVRSSVNGNVLPKTSGFGDITLRIKQNLWGNDGGKTALAAMPYITLPTAKNNDVVEGGIVFPFTIDLKNGWNMGSQVQIDILKNEDNNRYHSSILTSIALGKDLTSRLGFFAESFYTYDFREAQSDLYLDGGLTFSITPNLKLDAGVNLGITKGSDKVYFAGFSFRY